MHHALPVLRASSEGHPQVPFIFVLIYAAPFAVLAPIVH